MEYIINESKHAISLNEINHLAELVGWGKDFFSSPHKWQTVLSASSHIAYIKEQNKLIAFGRILEDGQMCMFYDICVHPQYQRQKIGSLIMNHLINKIKGRNFVSVGLFVWQGNVNAKDFYRNFGFELSTAMELKSEMKPV
ncbi:GNAT family acetyltransferase [Legionella quinlivanii]|uniref:GNAT family acetyltransferase n=1 Tax=Legionella quinlivanii TaxID=45073 RepID=A0A0W0XNH8_9GAMM|nr:GNAT family N-acetyltransferase [Legionella quinlivanii]KTD46120.1 GNAT family acetyltransferase [Legionella quinlivanii]MCW8451190.1 GNAT family N-acetyltransferase [Legionella quinlivanii]SEG28190.1 Acetyltransferase (GNAT) domain-containing protein [Legionella quinlivanii DSM 21216]STY10617.1 GNAT family acetyltransferase [Legionella quinlivanii]